MMVYNAANMRRKDAKNTGMIHQLSTCNLCFGGLMIVCFYNHRPPSIPDGILSCLREGKVM